MPEMLQTCKPQLQEENSKVWTQGGEKLNPSSRRTEVKDSIREDNIKQLLSEFKELHEQRLKCLEMDTDSAKEELSQKKMDFLQSYVDDLTDQNQLLVQTIADFQQDSAHKVSTLGMKPFTSDMSYIDLRTLQLDDLTGPALHIPHSSGSLLQIASESEDLKIQLQAQDMVISNLEWELGQSKEEKQKATTQVLNSTEKLAKLQSELSCLQRIHKDNMKEIAGKDVCITKLRATVQLLQQEGLDTHIQLSELNVRTKELQEELKKKEEKWRQIEVEQKMKDEKVHKEAEERRRQEQEKREEWMKRLKDEMRREEEWKTEQDRKASTEAIKKWAEKVAKLNSELEASRKQVERQSKQLSEFHLKEETLLYEAESKMVHLKKELSGLFERRMEEKETKIDQLTAKLEEVRQKIKQKEDHVRHLDQDVVGLRASEDSLKRTLAVKEEHAQQLVQCNTELKESLAILQSKLQTSEGTLKDLNEALDQTRRSLQADRQEREKILEQLHRTGKEVERLQLELSHVRRTAEKKIQRREIKMCALVNELTQSEKQHSACQKELLQTEKGLEKLREEMDELRAKLGNQSRECVHLNQTKERLEADLALSHEKLHTSHLEVRCRDQLILQLRDEMKTSDQKHRDVQKQVAALEGEVRHLNHKVRGHQEEACQLNEKVRDIDRLQDQKEKEQQQLHNQLHICQQQVKTFEEKLRKQESENELLNQRLELANSELKEALMQAHDQIETTAIFKQKYTAAVEKVQIVQGHVDLLEEELRYSRQQLKESQFAADSMKEEITDLERRYKEKVSQWETSQEALDQLTDDLQASQNLLSENQQKVHHFKNLTESLQEQVDTLKKQKLMLECDLQLYQQQHSHSDEEYLGLFRLVPPLQKHCAEQADRLAECEKAILQMKSELERQTKKKEELTQSLAASHRVHLNVRSQLEQEVACLQKKVACLQHELTDNQKVEVTLFRQSEEDLKEARKEALRWSGEVDVLRGEVQRLQEEMQKEEKKMKSTVRENQSLNVYTRQLNQELEDLHRKHQVTVEELAARAEEARWMEGCLNEGKLAEEKIRSMAARLEKEVTEIRSTLQQAVSQKLQAEKEKQDAQELVNKLRSELERTQADNSHLRHESHQVMTHVNLWITDQKASSESLATQVKAQNKLLLIITAEKEHLQEANDTLKMEVKALKEVVFVKERDMERFKADVQDWGIWQDNRMLEKKDCVALNLSKVVDMQTRLQSNLEAIGKLNQQLNILSRENKRLRRQLEEERSARRQDERLLPPPHAAQKSTSIHRPLSLSARPPPPPSVSFLSSGCPPSLDPVTVGDTDWILNQKELSAGEAESPGESWALGEALWMRPSAESAVSLEDRWPGRTSRHLAK